MRVTFNWRNQSVCIKLTATLCFAGSLNDFQSVFEFHISRGAATSSLSHFYDMNITDDTVLINLNYNQSHGDS